ncbi:MAG: cation diffusion facilitator family transporter [Halosimplex sp.]
MAESKAVVIAAFLANAVIAAVKFGGFLLTGSTAMLSETYHSVADTGNQLFLFVGIWFGEREPDSGHPFGHGKAQFFYGFLVSVLLFGIAGWSSLRKGYAAVTGGETHLTTAPATLPGLGVRVPGLWVNYGILLLGIPVEGYALWKAYGGMADQIDEHGWAGLREAFHKTSQVSTLTAFTEGVVTISGLGVALVGLALTQVTGDPFYDGAAAILIGLLLMAFALALAWENKRLLLGENLARDELRRLREAVRDVDGVRGVENFQAVYFGPDRVVVTGHVAFADRMDLGDVDESIAAVERRLRDENEKVAETFIEPET